MELSEQELDLISALIVTATNRLSQLRFDSESVELREKYSQIIDESYTLGRKITAELIRINDEADKVEESETSEKEN